MIHFQYKGKDKLGEIVSGYVDGMTRYSASILLKRKEIIPIELKIIEDKDLLANFMLKFNIKIGYPSLDDLIIVSKQLYALTRAGVPIIRSIRVVADSVVNRKLAIALEDIITNLESGQALGVCIKKYDDIFPTIFYSLVQVGENTGSLDQVFNQLSTHFAREVETIQRIKSATRYPLIVIITLAIAVGVINIFVIPSFATFFGNFGVELPLPTRILLASSHFTVHYWYVIVLSIVSAFVLWRSYIKTKFGRLKWDKWKIRIPIIGPIIEKSLLARFSRAFALCSRTGVPILESISIIAETTDNKYVGGKISSIKESVERGGSMTQASQESELFTPLVIQMMSIGEETGDLDKLLDEVAEFYEQEVDYSLKTLSDLIEPILIGIVAIMVLILALGVFLPMWDISKVALRR